MRIRNSWNPKYELDIEVKADYASYWVGQPVGMTGAAIRYHKSMWEEIDNDQSIAA